MQKQLFKNKLIQPAISCVIALCLLIISIMAISYNHSLGWFSSNDKVSANNMQVSIQGTDISVSYYYKTKTMSDFEAMTSSTQMLKGLLPGDSVSIRVIYTNNDERDFTINAYLDYENGYEVPIISEDKYYYLSSQLVVNETTSLLPNAIDNLYFTSAQIPQDISLKEFELDSGEEYTFDFTITFINLDVDQNIYQDFGSSDNGGKCYRKIISQYSVIE